MDFMKNKVVLLSVIMLGIIFILVFSSRTDVVSNILKLKNKSTEVTILATTDLHSLILISYLSLYKMKDKRIKL